MTKQDGAIITAYMGVLCCDIQVFYQYAEKLIGRALWTHEYANKEVWEDLKRLSYVDFIRLMRNQTEK